MKRSGPLRRLTPLRNVTPLRSRRRKRDHGDRPLAAWCEIAVAGVCTGRAEHRHHVRLQSQGGRGGPTLDCCHACHHYAHLNRDVARAHGWIIDRKTGITPEERRARNAATAEATGRLFDLHGGPERGGAA